MCGFLSHPRHSFLGGVVSSHLQMTRFSIVLALLSGRFYVESHIIFSIIFSKLIRLLLMTFSFQAFFSQSNVSIPFQSFFPLSISLHLNYFSSWSVEIFLFDWPSSRPHPCLISWHTSLFLISFRNFFSLNHSIPLRPLFSYTPFYVVSFVCLFVSLFVCQFVCFLYLFTRHFRLSLKSPPFSPIYHPFLFRS